MILQTLEKQKLIHPPNWMIENTMYLTIMGSSAYGVSKDTSDLDIYGFCIPPKENIFPHLKGEIPGFGRQIQRFEQWSEHHVKNGDKEYDFSVYSIVKYFQLVMENNPNMIDSIFTPRRCVIHATQISELVRENRLSFLHKGSFHKFRGYAMAQFSKIKNKANSSNPKRAKDIEEFGMDLKFSYHLVRLLLEVEQILVEHTLDLERNNEVLKAIRRGEWTYEYLEEWFKQKELHLEHLYATSNLRNVPDEDKIKDLLLKCLEIHYGSLSNAVKIEVPVEKVLSDLEQIIQRYKS